MPTLEINGTSVTAPGGATMLESARAAGISIPTLCWYPKLPVVGNCRLCVVSVAGQPKLVPACATPVADGMVVATESGDALAAMAHGLWIGLALLATAGTVRFALRGQDVDAEQLYAALGAYLLAGLLFGILYEMMDRTWPGSFVAGGAAAELTPASAIYFSFVTIATLGYGDIVPGSNVARGIAVVEAVAGQLYVAVMIARLVAAYAGAGEHDAAQARFALRGRSPQRFPTDVNSASSLHTCLTTSSGYLPQTCSPCG